MNEKLNKVYKVYIHKIYFPKEKQTKELFVSSQYEDKVIATSRTEAAEKVWARNGKKWLKEMEPKQTTIRIICLHVNDPRIGTCGLAHRLNPIKVYTEK